MNGAAVFLVAFFTSAATSVGAVYLTGRLHVFDEPQKPETFAVPDFEGLDQARASSFAGSLGLVVSIDGHEESASKSAGTVIRQTLVAGQMVTKGEKLGLTLAKEVPIPSVVGRPLAEGRKALEEAGYEVAVEEINDDSVPEGTIATQSPKAGAPPGEERKVTVEVSAGSSLIEVPKLIGMSLAKATKALEELELEAKVRWVDLPETWSGVVLSQTPEPKDKAQKGADVEIVINR